MGERQKYLNLESEPVLLRSNVETTFPYFKMFRWNSTPGQENGRTPENPGQARKTRRPKLPKIWENIKASEPQNQTKRQE